MKELIQVFTLYQWIIIIGLGPIAIAAGLFLRKYFKSRYWIEAVTNPATGLVVAGDVMKMGSFVLGCILTIAIAIAKLIYERSAGGELIVIDLALLGFSTLIQDIKRRGNTPAAPNFNVTDSKVSIGPNGSAQAQTGEQPLAGYNDGPNSTTGRTATQPNSTE